MKKYYYTIAGIKNIEILEHEKEFTEDEFMEMACKTPPLDEITEALTGQLDELDVVNYLVKHCGFKWIQTSATVQILDKEWYKQCK